MTRTADSLVFMRPAIPMRLTAAGAPETVITLPRQNVQSVTLEKLSITRTALFFASMAALLAIAAMAGQGVTGF